MFSSKINILESFDLPQIASPRPRALNDITNLTNSFNKHSNHKLKSSIYNSNFHITKNFEKLYHETNKKLFQTQEKVVDLINQNNQLKLNSELEFEITRQFVRQKLRSRSEAFFVKEANEVKKPFVFDKKKMWDKVLKFEKMLNRQLKKQDIYENKIVELEKINKTNEKRISLLVNEEGVDMEHEKKDLKSRIKELFQKEQYLINLEKSLENKEKDLKKLENKLYTNRGPR